VLGKRVLVVGLIKAPAFNGEWGRVESYDAGLQRFIVRVLRDSGPPLLAKLRRENLVVPPTVALRFDDEARLSAGLRPEASPAWRAEPAFVPCSPPPENAADEFFATGELLADEANEIFVPDDNQGVDFPATDASSSTKTVPSASPVQEATSAHSSLGAVTVRELPEKWKPSLRGPGLAKHWWGEADLDSSGTMSSGGPKEQSLRKTP